MIITSHFRTFFFWFSNLCVLFSVTCLLLLINGNFETPNAGKFALAGLALLMFWIYGKMLWEVKKISIDIAQKTITFRNRFTSSTKTFDLADFEGFTTYYQQTKFGSFKVIYFVKDQTLVYKMSRAFYSNQSELIDAIRSDIKDLGELQYSFLDSLKTLFGQKVFTK